MVNSLLLFGVDRGRLAALADSVHEPAAIDGVVEWPIGSVPLPGGVTDDRRRRRSDAATAASDTFQLVEYDIVGPAELNRATGTVDVVNSGEFPHTLVVTNLAGEVVAATPLIAPGESVDLSLDLETGRYSVTCRVVAQSPEGDIIDHFEEGMSTMVSIGG